MFAAYFDIFSFSGRERYIIGGKDASEIMAEFERFQDFSCLVRMGRSIEKEEGQKQLDNLVDLVGKYHSGDLTMDELKTFKLDISIGSIECKAVAEGEEEIAALIEEYPEAFQFNLQDQKQQSLSTSACL